MNLYLSVLFTLARFFSMCVCFFPPLKLTFALIMAKSGIQMDNSLQSAL